MALAAQILIFSRFPVPKLAKTRLIPLLGPEGAAQLHRRMTEHAVLTARRVVNTRQADDIGITICTSGARQKYFRAWLGHDLQYLSQTSGDIGSRMRCAFKSAFRRGAKRVLAFGSDIPGLPAEILVQALDALHSHDIVLGPARDGGYYLIGMKRNHPELFRGIDWGTEHVCDQTKRVIHKLGLTFIEMAQQNDIDRPEDLAALLHNPKFFDVFTKRPLVSVIIPTYNEEAVLGHTLKRISGAENIEIIVADGGSTDSTHEIAEKAGAVLLSVQAGRAHQLNAGAAAAKGNLLLFIHADTLPPDGYADLIRRALDNPSTVAGAFRFQTDSSRTAIRIIEWGANIRSAVFRWPYGDQGLFMEKRVFDEMGGFASLPIMEDFDLVRRLRRRGPIKTLPEAATTSARRWLQLGVLQTTIINQLMIAGYIGSVPMHVLERFYRKNSNVRENAMPIKEQSIP